MLRITVKVDLEVLTLRLEGSLSGPWLKELDDSWQRSLDCQHVLNRLVDLTGVTFVDAAGKNCLAAMHRQGAEFVAADCMIKAIVAEITQPPDAHDQGPAFRCGGKIARDSRQQNEFRCHREDNQTPKEKENEEHPIHPEQSA